MSIARCPVLSSLYSELRSLVEAESASTPKRYRLSSGRDVQRLEWPGAGSFWLDGPQRRVVAMLLDAYLNSRSPDVPERALLGAAEVKARKLSELFARGEAWGKLIVPGDTPASYRLREMPAEIEEEATRTVDEE